MALVHKPGPSGVYTLSFSLPFYLLPFFKPFETGRHEVKINISMCCIQTINRTACYLSSQYVYERLCVLGLNI